MRAAVIDIGSSSIKLIIGEKAEDSVKIIESLKNALPIGKQTFFKGRISQELINQTISFLDKYKQVLKEYEVTTIRVIATTAVREATNKDMFMDTIVRKTGFNIEIFNVGDVIYYIDTYLSKKLKKAYPIHEKNLIIAELGAGSLDISVMEKGQMVMSFGFPIGTLRLKQFTATLDGSLSEIHEAVREYIENEITHLKRSIPQLPIDDIILIDENYSAFLQNILPNKRRESNFFKFKEGESKEFLEKLVDRNSDDIASTYKVPPEVADTIVGYATIVNLLFKLTKNDYIYILETSLAEAILANVLFQFEDVKENNMESQLISVAQFLCTRFNMDLKHSRHVAKFSEELFSSLHGALGLQEKDSLYLILAAYLHDIGMFINNRSHHKHTEFIINSLNLFRLTDEEIRIIACIGRYHRRGAPSPSHPIYNSLSPEKQILVQKLSALLRLANALDRSHKQKVKRCEIAISKKQDVTLTVYTNDNFLLEKSSFNEKKGLFEEITGNKINLVVKSTD